jgi:hypothetical protein
MVEAGSKDLLPDLKLGAPVSLGSGVMGALPVALMRHAMKLYLEAAPCYLSIWALRRGAGSRTQGDHFKVEFAGVTDTPE